MLSWLKSSPLVEIREHVDVTKEPRISVHNENGRLRKVVVLPPPYLDWDCACPINEKEKANAKKGIMPDRFKATQEWGAFVANLIAQDVKVVILQPKPHLLEATYTRDPAFVVDSKLFIGSMHADVRKPETGLYVNGGISAPQGHNITIEGGNVVLGKDCVFVGVGDRTTLEGALWLQNWLGTSRQVIPLKLKQGVLHLDCVFGPHDSHNKHPGRLILDKKAFVGNGGFSALDMRNIQYQAGYTLPSLKGLEEATKRYAKVTNLKHSERNKLVPNMVMVRPNLAIANFLPDRVKSVLDSFMKVIVLPFGELALGDGSYRCATMPLVREKP
jgi:N-dimethylarginine dimethylaminohydrolase